MKKFLCVAAFLFSSLLPVQVKAELTPNICSSLKENLVKVIDDKTVLCSNTSTKLSVSLDLFRYYSETNSGYMVSVLKFINRPDGEYMVNLNEGKGLTTFLLSGRTFSMWIKNPDASIVERHREQISILINLFEKTTTLSSPNF